MKLRAQVSPASIAMMGASGGAAAFSIDGNLKGRLTPRRVN